MKYFRLLGLLLVTSLNANELSFGAASLSQSKTTAKHLYSIQILSSKSLDDSLGAIKKVPEKYRSGLAVYQVGDYFAARYIDAPDAKSLPGIINDFKKAGFPSPITYGYNPNRTPLNTNKIAIGKQKQTPPSTTTITAPQAITQTLNQHDRTRLSLDAQNAYDKHDYAQATIYYEMMVASGIKDRQTLLNLCYLYGREGSSSMMEKLVDGKRGINDYLYAYGVGALEAGRSDLYSILSPYLVYDKSGRLPMLCGYFFEQEKNNERATAFYKMAYETNPSDPHILYAYTRSVDISGDKEKALYLYTQLTQLGSEFEPLRVAAQSRIQTLRRLQ